jgi:5-methyltetrahydropteroyltriglutamate--homocysteine methyltransferase
MWLRNLERNFMIKMFPTQEVGSLAKPKWRVKSYRGEQLSKEEIADAADWGIKLEIKDIDKLVKLLSGKKPPNRRLLFEWSAKYAIRLLETAGLDIVFNGEQWRSEMYEYVIRNTSGFKFLGYVKSFDFRYFRKAACVGKPRSLRPFYLDEFLFTKKNTEKEIKVPITGPYTLADWTFNEYYEKKLAREIKDLKKRKSQAKRELVFDLIEEVIRPEISRLVDAGARWIQIDEPATTTNPTNEEMKLFVEAFNETVEGFNCTFSLHNCYSNYEVLAKYTCELRNCSQLSLEFANRDSREIGIEDERTGYKEVRLFEDYGFQGNYGLGVVDVHTNFIEPPELVRDRILHVVKTVKDPSRIYVSTDCGLRTRSWEVSFRKLRNMVLGAESARKAVA